MAPKSRLPEVLARHEKDLLQEWMRLQLASVNRRADLIKEDELREHSRQFLSGLTAALRTGEGNDIAGSEWTDVREQLGALSASRAQQGFTPKETATFVFSLKEPLFARLRSEIADGQSLAEEILHGSRLLDDLGLFTTESYQKN